MTSKHYFDICWIGLLALLAAVAGCESVPRAGTAAPQSINTEQVIADLTPDIESLYLAWHELDQTCKDIKFLERAFLFDPDDRQLGYIQNATLHIQDASVRIHQQWEQLSVLHYIRTDRMRDYLTLRVKGLTSAIDSIAYDEMFLTIYSPHISDAAISGDLNKARDNMKKCADWMNRILDRLLPIANASAPPVAL